MPEFNPDGSLKLPDSYKVSRTSTNTRILGKEYDYLNILKILDELDFNVGKKLILDLLKGNHDNKAIQRNSLTFLDHFASMSGYSDDEIFDMLENLVINNLISHKRENPKYGPVYSLTEKGKAEINNPSLAEKKVSSKINNTDLDFSAENNVTDEERKLFSSFDFFLKGFNDDQKLSIIKNNPYILCIAGAGSGKTFALTKRIEFLIRFRSVPSEKILAITFTRKACEEMKSRLNRFIPNNQVVVETFNSFCEKFLKKHNDLYYDKEYRVISIKEKIRLVVQALEKINMTLDQAINNYFSKRQVQDKDRDSLVFTFVSDVFFVFDLFNNQGLEFFDFTDNCSYLSQDDCEKVTMIYEVCALVKESMQDLGLRDFSDQITHTIDIMQSNKDIIPQFKHILVDEYQDINSVQVRLLDLLSPDNLFCVGDPRQSIYGWRGSKIDYILRFKEKFPDSSAVFLNKNYRSSDRIVKLINKTIKNMSLPDLSSNNQEVGKCILISHPDEQSEFLFLLNSIKALDIPLEEIFILARKNKSLKSFSDILHQNKIPHMIKTEDYSRGDEGITLATIHAAKGLEAKVVYVIQANSNNFPCQSSEHPVHGLIKVEEYDKEEEERRLFYVALSRAKEKLIISYTSTLTKFFTDSMMDFIENIAQAAGTSDTKKTTKTQRQQKSLNHFAQNISDDDVISRLKKYRLEAAHLFKVPAYMIFSDKTMMDLASTLPTTMSELELIYGLGPNKIKRFGEDILNVISGTN